MSLRSVVESLICGIVEEKLKRGTGDQILTFKFSLGMDYDKFHDYSYHNMELMFWRPGNYTLVAVRKQITVIAQEHLKWPDMEGWTEEEKCYAEPELTEEYTDGHSEWTVFSFHDSCWRSDGVSRVVGHLDQKEDNVSLGGLMDHCVLQEVNEHQQEKLWELTDYDNKQYRQPIPTLHELYDQLRNGVAV